MKCENLADVAIEECIPHRGKMLLIDRILELEERRAVTLSEVKPSWPFFEGSSVSNLVLIELAAQTAGICNGWFQKMTSGPDADNLGWLVGVKRADLRIDRIPASSQITTFSENTFKYDKLREVSCTLRCGSKRYGEIVLQLMQS